MSSHHARYGSAVLNKGPGEPLTGHESSLTEAPDLAHARRTRRCAAA